MGAKPSIEIKLVNEPDQHFYLALLESERGASGTNSELKLDNVNEETVQKYLEDFYYNGWEFFQSPVGQNIYENQEDGEYFFSYMVPYDFKIIIICDDGRVYLSDNINPKEFDAVVIYDVETGTLTEYIEDKTVRHTLYVVICFLLTLAMELLVLKLFRYPFTKRNIFCFILINLLTNVPFNTFLINQHTDIVMVFLWIFAEALIMLIESIFYLITLRDTEGKPRRGKSFLYGVVANLVSAILGLVILWCYVRILPAL
ncbi:MAG: hypothetical protein K6E10_11340 [Eubacterium sp.]|nr:hypothetical protein [Eubacterium sp.]